MKGVNADFIEIVVDVFLEAATTTKFRHPYYLSINNYTTFLSLCCFQWLLHSDYISYTKAGNELT